MPMVPRHIYEGTDYLNNPANNTPIGTGPYKFKEWRRGSYIQLVRNEQYHEAGLPSVDTLYFHVIPDAASRAAAFESGKLDVLPGGTVEYFDIARLKALPNVETTTKGWEFFGPHSFMWLNNRHPVLADVRVRRAIMYALDREAMRNVAWYGFGKVATGPFNSSVRYYTDQVTRYPRDVARAKQLLKEAGYKGQTLRLLPLPYGETWQRYAEIARQNPAEVGIKLEMTATDVAGWSEDRQLGLRHRLLLPVPIRRRRAGREPQLPHVHHRQGLALEQRRGLQQPQGRRAVRTRRAGSRSAEAPRAVRRGAAHPGRRGAGGLAAGTAIPHALPQQHQEPDQFRHRFER